MNDTVTIQSRDFWFKVTGMLQQNWALIDPDPAGVIVYFLGDTSGVFDEMRFRSNEEAAHALETIGFRRLAPDVSASTNLLCPEPPFARLAHPNGPIYSSRSLWKNAQ